MSDHHPHHSKIVDHTILTTIDALASSGQLKVLKHGDHFSQPPVTVFATQEACALLKQMDLEKYIEPLQPNALNVLQQRYNLEDCQSALRFGNYDYKTNEYIDGLAKEVGSGADLLAALANAPRLEKAAQRDLPSH